MDATRFREHFGEHADYWSGAPDFPCEDWRYEVESGDTLLGYWDWVVAQREACAEDNEEG